MRKGVGWTLEVAKYRMSDRYTESMILVEKIKKAILTKLIIE